MNIIKLPPLPESMSQFELYKYCGKVYTSKDMTNYAKQAISLNIDFVNEENERKSFEQWLSSEGEGKWLTRSDTNGTYFSSTTRKLWRAWKARAKLKEGD